MMAPEPEVQPAPEVPPAPETTAETTSEAAQPKLGELDAPKKGTAIEEDLLDIPAFLRRQAN